MKLATADYVVIALFFAVNLGIGLYYAQRGGKSVSEFFLSGRNVPWWLAGISMVATTFAVDTPLAVTGLVTQHGIAGNWLWWSLVMSGILTVFFFAKLWRRSGVLTDVEFIELRYSGKPAAALRLVRAIFQGVLVNTVVMGWVNLAMAKILSLTLHVPKFEALAVCLVFTAIYVTIGGLWGVLVTDLLQFVVKMSMAIVLAVCAVAAVGGIGALKIKLADLDAAHHVAASGSVLAFFPTTNEAWLPLLTFVTFIAVQWWASSYPGAEPGGGGYIAQRIFSARSENDALGASLFFNIAHYALRPWPWILVALATLVLYPHGVAGTDGKIDPELGYVQAMIDYLPAWLRGLMIAGFLAAYMSTIGTHLNLGASYLTNDLYRRFLVRSASEPHYVLISRLATLLVMALSLVGAYAMTSVSEAWQYLLNVTAGVGLVMILRWYWWRVSAWSEIAALGASAFVSNAIYISGIFRPSDPNQMAKILLVTVPVTTLVWITVTLCTRPESQETLVRFYERVQPAGAGWRPITAIAQVPGESEPLGVSLVDWIAGCGLVYGALFGIGKFVLAEPAAGCGWSALAALCAAVIIVNMRRYRKAPTGAPTVALEALAPRGSQTR
ncbi:MAG TPA: sodium:solute symporter family protein [Candidatus Acidoferrales bacterium]|nr:sodium:solute symporter family protein [Candidatus Acidoferrales bacterium]